MEEPIAIIGTSCRLPGGVNSPSKLWELLKHPADLSSKIPSNRFNPDAFYHPNPERPGTSNVKKAYLLNEDPLVFDNDFFNISIREAESMDPQQRILLEIVYEAIEASGYTKSQLKGSSTGVFVGQMTDDYRDLLFHDFDCHPSYTGTGIARSILANRVSYAFDWKGPSLNIDTACSSSLVALHQAVQSLRRGECSMAVVAGVNLVFGPETFSQLSSLRMLSPTGNCRMWDTSADGYARGEGFVAIVLKTLTSAEVDGDDIETVIKNTGINQDGQSSGLTVPSADAQAELIRLTYKGCGLDCLNENERCQYFEAHGTGTQAGDPKEAQGISMAFSPDRSNTGYNADDAELSRVKEIEKLYVGSVKTVIGHTEGTAGLASLLKASLVVKHGIITPNLHFNRLNPNIEPYYHGLEVPVSPKNWPTLPLGAPRRASVNSFGFGGTNAHAILESYELQNHSPKIQTCSRAWGPFVLSANSKPALRSVVVSLLKTLKSRTKVDLSRLAWTLQTHRTKFKHRVSVSATDKEQLIARLELVTANIDQCQITANLPTNPTVRVLGIFTGQGAQWASMGASLVRNSASSRRTFEGLDSVLQALHHGPTWSLVGELLRQDDAVATLSAEVSQPLCTAIQIALVDLLRACGILFTAVIGHSSGEIAAAYAAGVLTASDAITIAYLRGYHCGKHNKENCGRMMAVGMSPEEARQFCQQQCFMGRLVVAAENSISSVTLSGDAEAIERAKDVLDNKKVFNRILKTDTAYHSHHMRPVREPYSTSLNEAGIKAIRNCFKGTCNWYSTVYDPKDSDTTISPASFDGLYWTENLVKPVMFSPAIISALEGNTFDIALEIGPHPALRGPAMETIRAFLGNDLPYVGVMERNKDALETFSAAIGTIWCHTEAQTAGIDFPGFRTACSGVDWAVQRVYKDLPPYPWDHERPMIRESRKTHLRRSRKSPLHELLGYPVSWSENEWHWRNILRLDDVYWLQCHQFQRQALIPASAYIVMAIDAALQTLGSDRPVKILELRDVVIHNGIALEASSSAIELNFSISRVEENERGRTVDFSCRCSNADTASPEFSKEVVTGRILVLFGAINENLLPSRTVPNLPMTDVAVDRFYHWMDKIGLQYSGPFVLESIERRLNLASVITKPTRTDDYIVHPGTLDSVLQGLYAAFSYPGDGRFWTTYLPKSFQLIRFDVGTYFQVSNDTDSRLVADCFITDSSAREIGGDIDVFLAADGHPVVQLQGVVLSSLEMPSAANDRTVFWHTIWKQDISSIVGQNTDQDQLVPLVDEDRWPEKCEKVACSYVNQLLGKTKPHEMKSTGWYFPYLMDLASKLTDNESEPPSDTRCPHNRHSKNTESMDTLEGDQSSRQIDLELVNYAGSRISSIFHGSGLSAVCPETEKLIDRFYTEGVGAAAVKNHLGTIVDHLVHRYPKMSILELTAGAGNYTNVFLEHFKSNFEDYYFTDSVPAGFSAAQARFATHYPPLTFQALDIERPPTDQGFEAHSYDVVIAIRILSSTSSIKDALNHCRQLLRPGGYLILLEMTNPTALRNLFLLPLLPSWRLDQKQFPILTESQWDSILRETSFSGVDVVFRDFERDSAHGLSVMVSQAANDQILALKDPLTASDNMISIDNLLIVGGRTLIVSQMASKIRSILHTYSGKITIIPDLGDASNIHLEQGTAVICLCDLEEPIFRKLDRLRISGMQTLFREAQYILWATRGCLNDDPYANISVGIGRTASRELPHLRARFVNFESLDHSKGCTQANVIAKLLLQMVILDLPSCSDILWSNETEIFVSNGIPLIPRVLPHQNMNDRLNCSRREIMTTVPIDSLSHSLSLNESSPLAIYRPDHITILSSSLVQFKSPDQDKPFHMCIAYIVDEGRYSLIFSERGSMVSKGNDRYALTWHQETDADELLSSILLILLCENFLSNSTGTVWIHNADPGVCETLCFVANCMGVPIFLTKDNMDMSPGLASKAIQLHPRAPTRVLKSLIPRSIKRFINMGASNGTSATDFALHFPWHELEFRPGLHNVSIHEPYALTINASNSTVLSKYFAQKYFLHDIGIPVQKNIIQADQLQNQQKTSVATSVVSWAGVESIHIPLSAATDDHIFGPHKTYLLVGLTGEVGLSLCEWMIDHGARHIALASRNPAVPPQIITHLEMKGATVRVFALDVANKDNLGSVYQEIMSTMPPVAGVANGALVVRDHPFDGLSHDDLKAVFEPKVMGSINLDNLFYSTPLDFFILFSSMASIYGKPGQSSYNAANLFMSTLAEKRRNRGLAASTLHLGMMLGLGHIHGPAEAMLEAKFRQEDLMAIPEPEFHRIFAQAVLSGRLESGLSPQVIAGLGTEVDTEWRALPIFAHCHLKRDEKNSSHHQRNKPDSAESIQVTIKHANNQEQVLAILKRVIGRRIELALGMTDNSLDENSALLSMGFDSLVAVEIRSWLLKMLKVNIPVLVFLNGLSLLDICHETLSQLSESLKPRDNDQYGNDNANKEGNTNSCAKPILPAFGETTTADVAKGSATINPDDSLQTPVVISAQQQNGEQPKNSLKYERIGPMSHSQAQLYFLHEYLQNNAYNIAYYGTFHGPLNMSRLKGALRVVGKRHEGLRSAFFTDMVTSSPVQAVLSDARITFEQSTADEGIDMQNSISQVKDFKFDIENGVAMKVSVITHSSTRHSILFTHHHIALDGLSWKLFISDLAMAYSGGMHTMRAPPQMQQPIEMATKQLGMFTHQSLESDLAFWRAIYKTIPDPLPLFPFTTPNHARPSSPDYNVAISNVRISKDLTRRIEQVASNIGVTQLQFYLATFVMFLSRCLNVRDLAIGLVDANRHEGEDLDTIGYFLNMLPIRMQLSHSDSLNLIARRARDAVVAAMAHSCAPLDVIINHLKLPRSTSHHPLFQVAINYSKSPFDETKFGRDGKIVWDGGVPGGHPYDLMLNIGAMREWTFISLVGQRSLYKASDVALLHKWYMHALEILAHDPSIRLENCPVSNPTHLEQARNLGRGMDIDVKWKGTITDRVDEIAASFAASTAVIDDQGHAFTYSQLARRTTHVKELLQSVAPPLVAGSRVATLLDPTADTISCILAVLGIGLTWIPLDTLNHHLRIRAIVEQCRPQVLLCHGSTARMAQEVVASADYIHILNIDDITLNVDIHSCQNGDKSSSLPNGNGAHAQASHPAMILFTSGSTGVPKGVMLSHEGLMNQIYGTTMFLNLGVETTLQQSPLGFDLMLDQIFLALCSGGTAVIVGKNGRGDPVHIANLMVKHNVTLTHFVPSEYSVLLNYGHHILTKTSSWRYAMSGGEPLRPNLLRAFRHLDCPNLQLINVYGPAEITLACARGTVPYRDPSSVGDIDSDWLLPSHNYSIDIVDANMNLLPVGFPGEICISGPGVGLGYIGRPRESEYSFVQRESAGPTPGSVRIYRSGDMGRLMPDGTLKVLGRIGSDSQVKINGFRVELDEVANTILRVADDALVSAATSWRPSQSSGTLVAFVVFEARFTKNRSEFLESLRENLPLPSYMKPRFIIPITQIPSTVNGKIDRGAVDQLAIPDFIESAESNYVPPVFSSSEHSMKEIWEEVLADQIAPIPGSSGKGSVIQPSSDFFAVGGSSILMIKLKSLLQAHFGVTVPMPELFRSSTLSTMSTLITGLTQTKPNGANIQTTEAFLRAGVAQQVMDWDLEIASLVDGLPKPQPHLLVSRGKPSDDTQGLIIVLTGATGFIGKHLLWHLVQNPRVAEVHCIAIRPNNDGQPRRLPLQHEKVFEYVGDLSDINLGLSGAEFSFLVEHADAIIHNGADVSLLKTYSSLRRTNVISTRRLCEMAIPRKIPMHYVSTASVAKVIEHSAEHPLLEVAAVPVDATLLNSVDGYAASKWVSETLLEKLAAHKGLPTYVHRLAHVVGEDASELDVVGMLTKYSLILRALPRIKEEFVTGVWDFVAVRDVASDIVEMVIESQASRIEGTESLGLSREQDIGVRFVNHCGDAKVPHRELGDFLEKLAGGQLKDIDMRDWVDAASEKGLHPLVREFFVAFEDGRGKLVLPVIARSN
ncbi:hybrid PKS-NRPS PsoA [Xylaria bambusicola]|uniref:hybrid PKS-NRPS PsoA n=1 Tax=Xylaria bambusicola TaxID=326684 RepID=UPI002008990E|nr:hybrid PKS-NRPS PsoA [Xylaria bambusicola]KAI0508465.1 hybrid PKS-NRPS PsoA [Xylaria bambusicola]